MARRNKEVSQTGVGATGWIPMDYRNSSGAKMVISCIVSGTANYTVEYTSDDLWDADNAPTTLFDHDTLADLAVSTTGNIEFMPRAIRLTVNSGTGTVTMQMVPSA